MKNLFCLISLLALLVSGCTREEMLRNGTSVSGEGRVFSTSFEKIESRTYLEDGHLSRWTEGDRISLFDANTLNSQYLFAGDTGDSGGTFFMFSKPEGTGAALSANYAVYPYDKDMTISADGVITLNLPSEQHYAENSYGLGDNTMVAVTENTDDTFLQFKNVGGCFKFQLYGDDVTVKSITLKGNNGEKIAGKATLAPTYGKAPIVAMADDATTFITLDCGEKGVKIGSSAEKATAFWMVVPLTTFEKGITIMVKDMDGKTFVKSTSKELVIGRNVVKPMAAVEFHTSITEQERAALIEFYHATNGPQWTNNDNWCSDKPLSEWNGVSVRNNRVYRIQLPYNGLEGEIPDSFFMLTEATWINFEGNSLSGNLSDKFGNFTKVNFLGLGNNNFTGSIPKEFANLVNLTYLSLRKNKLSGMIPSELFDMSNWESVIKDSYEPQQSGYGIEWPATLETMNLGDGIYMHPEGIALEYRVNQLKMPNHDEVIYICNNVYKKVSDSFDFIFIVCNSNQLTESFSGRHSTVKNTIQGIGKSLFDNSAIYGSSGRLKGINELKNRGGIYSNGPFLHELCHYWGAINIGQEHGDANGHYYDYGHWGISDVHGQLGGFDYATLETNVDGNPNKYKASSFWGQTEYNKKVFLQAGTSNNVYAPLELYLMGLIPVSDVPDIHIYKNVRAESNTASDGIFYAESSETITMEKIIQDNGVRVPDWQDSQKSFRGLVVVLTEKKINDYEWGIIKQDVLLQELQQDDNNPKKANFWEATGGRATIKLSGLKETLR